MPHYPDELLEQVRDLLLIPKGPVEVASIIGKSRPTTNKIIAEAKSKYGIGSEKSLPAALTGDHKKVSKAKKMMAQGKPNTEIYKELGVGRREGERILETAKDTTAAAIILNPEVLDAHVKVSLDVMSDIQDTNSKLKLMAKTAASQLTILQKETAYDVDRIGEGDELHGGWHARQANILRAIDVIRKVQESILKGVQVHQKILEHLFDVRRVNEMLQDIHMGVRDGITELHARGLLACETQQAINLISRAIKERFGKRKGLI